MSLQTRSACEKLLLPEPYLFPGAANSIGLKARLFWQKTVSKPWEVRFPLGKAQCEALKICSHEKCAFLRGSAMQSPEMYVSLGKTQLEAFKSTFSLRKRNVEPQKYVFPRENASRNRNR